MKMFMHLYPSGAAEFFPRLFGLHWILSGGFFASNFFDSFGDVLYFYPLPVQRTRSCDRVSVFAVFR